MKSTCLTICLSTLALAACASQPLEDATGGNPVTRTSITEELKAEGFGDLRCLAVHLTCWRPDGAVLDVLHVPYYFGSTSWYFDAEGTLLARIIGRVFAKKLEKMRFKYLSGHRTPAAFSRYKTYRLLVLQRDPA
jgi:hypothetical protein